MVGTVAPDLAYFLPVPVEREESHSLAGLFWFCLPVGLLAYVAFYVAVAPLLVELLPWRVQVAVHGWADGRLPRATLAAVFVSLLVGAVTHIVWDSFTHSDGFVVVVVPALSEALFTWQGYTFYVFKLLQHGSTFMGGIILAWWGYTKLPQPPVESGARPPLRRLAALAALLILGPALLALVSGLDHLDQGTGILGRTRSFLSAAIFTGGSVLIPWVVLVGLLARTRQLVRGRSA